MLKFTKAKSSSPVYNITLKPVAVFPDSSRAVISMCVSPDISNGAAKTYIILPKSVAGDPIVPKVELSVYEFSQVSKKFAPPISSELEKSEMRVAALLTATHANNPAEVRNFRFIGLFR